MNNASVQFLKQGSVRYFVLCFCAYSQQLPAIANHFEKHYEMTLVFHSIQRRMENLVLVCTLFVCFEV